QQNRRSRQTPRAQSDGHRHTSARGKRREGKERSGRRRVRGPPGYQSENDQRGMQVMVRGRIEKNSVPYFSKAGAAHPFTYCRTGRSSSAWFASSMNIRALLPGPLKFLTWDAYLLFVTRFV